MESECYFQAATVYVFSSKVREVIIFSFDKYLLSTHVAAGTGLGAKNEMQGMRQSLVLWCLDEVRNATGAHPHGALLSVRCPGLPGNSPCLQLAPSLGPCPVGCPLFPVSSMASGSIMGGFSCTTPQYTTGHLGNISSLMRRKSILVATAKCLHVTTCEGHGF